jgi:hypothetical protein
MSRSHGIPKGGGPAPLKTALLIAAAAATFAAVALAAAVTGCSSDRDGINTSVDSPEFSGNPYNHMGPKRV